MYQGTEGIIFWVLDLVLLVRVVDMFEPGCSKPLGLMSGSIQDWQLSASSINPNDSKCQVKFARIHQPSGLGWCPDPGKGRDPHPWLLVDLGVITQLNGLILQGRGETQEEWVTRFTFSYSLDATKWDFVSNLYGEDMIFSGNVNSHHLRTIWFGVPLRARFIRVHLHEWHGAPSLRLELLGCQECSAIISGPGVGPLSASTHGPWAKKHSCQPEDGHIESHRAWCSKINNGEQWFQMELGPPATVTGILTRGRGDTGRKQWVTSYTVSYSNDTAVWYFYKEQNHLNPKLFGGNMDKGTERRHYLNSPFVARFVRIHPTSWSSHIAMRASSLGLPHQGMPTKFL